jgi:hypothetical protein
VVIRRDCHRTNCSKLPLGAVWVPTIDNGGALWRRMGSLLLLIQLVSWWMLTIEASYFKEIEKMFVGEHGRQATSVLQEDLAGGKDHPKLITISYPTVRR